MKIILRNSNLVFEKEAETTEYSVELVKTQGINSSGKVEINGNWPAIALAVIDNSAGNIIKVKYNTLLPSDVERRLYVATETGKFSLVERSKTSNEYAITSDMKYIAVGVYHGESGSYSDNIEEFIGDLTLGQCVSIIEVIL